MMLIDKKKTPEQAHKHKYKDSHGVIQLPLHY